MGTERDTGCQPRPNIICLEGNGSRPSHFGDGYCVSSVMYTLNGTEVHSVCYDAKEPRVNNMVAYGLITKGNGEVILSKEKHTSLSVGGGQAGQGYPAVYLQQKVIPINTMVATRENDEKRTTFGVGEPDDPQFTISAAHEHAVAVVAAVDCRNGTENECINGTLQAKPGTGFTLNSNNVVRIKQK